MGELGSTLRRAREARGLTLEDAERDTRISRRYLQALENEEFDIIPAPVYARGFLRSYSQYLGLDPQRMLALFPVENGPASRYAPPRPTAREPEAPPAGRPQWRRPTPEPFTPPSRGVRPLRPGERPGPSGGSKEYEPMIGVDIGVPRRPVEVGSAVPARTAIAAVAAIAITLFVLGLAFIIAQVGGGDGAPPAPTATATQTEDSPGENRTPGATSGLEVTPGVVPNVIGQPVEVARLAITEAGFVPSERVELSDRPAGIVIDQGPAPGVRGEPGDTVFIVVSGGR